jgi:hypothetical protein
MSRSSFVLKALGLSLITLVLWVLPASAIEPDPEPRFGVSVLGGIGGGGQSYEVMVDTPRGWEDDDEFVTQWQWFADMRLHGPPLGSLRVRPFLVGGYTRGFSGDGSLGTIDPIAISDIDVEFKDRWTVGLGASFPVEMSGRTFVEINPMLMYGRERGRAHFDLHGNFGHRSFSETLEIDQIVPALEFSFPVAPLGDIGAAHIAVGAQMPIDLGSDRASSGQVQLDGHNWAVGTFESDDRVGFAAYVALRLAFDVF